MEPEVSLCVHKITILVPRLSQVNPVCATLSFCKNDCSVIVHSWLCLPRAVFPSHCFAKTLEAFLNLPHTYLPRDPPAPFSSIWSPIYYVAKSTNCGASEYVVLCSLFRVFRPTYLHYSVLGLKRQVIRLQVYSYLYFRDLDLENA